MSQERRCLWGEGWREGVSKGLKVRCRLVVMVRDVDVMVVVMMERERCGWDLAGVSCAGAAVP